MLTCLFLSESHVTWTCSIFGVTNQSNWLQLLWPKRLARGKTLAISPLTHWRGMILCGIGDNKYTAQPAQRWQQKATWSKDHSMVALGDYLCACNNRGRAARDKKVWAAGGEVVLEKMMASKRGEGCINSSLWLWTQRHEFSSAKKADFCWTEFVFWQFRALFPMSLENKVTQAKNWVPHPWTRLARSVQSNHSCVSVPALTNP